MFTINQLQPCPVAHLVIQLFVQVPYVLLVLPLLVTGDGDTSSGWQQVVDDESVVVRLAASLIFRALLLLLRNVLPCDRNSLDILLVHPLYTHMLL